MAGRDRKIPDACAWKHKHLGPEKTIGELVVACQAALSGLQARPESGNVLDKYRGSVGIEVPSSADYRQKLIFGGGPYAALLAMYRGALANKWCWAGDDLKSSMRCFLDTTRQNAGFGRSGSQMYDSWSGVPPLWKESGWMVSTGSAFGQLSVYTLTPRGLRAASAIYAQHATLSDEWERRTGLKYAGHPRNLAGAANGVGAVVQGAVGAAAVVGAPVAVGGRGRGRGMAAAARGSGRGRGRGRGAAVAAAAAAAVGSPAAAPGAVVRRGAGRGRAAPALPPPDTSADEAYARLLQEELLDAEDGDADVMHWQHNAAAALNNANVPDGSSGDRMFDDGRDRHAFAEDQDEEDESPSVRAGIYAAVGRPRSGDGVSAVLTGAAALARSPPPGAASSAAAASFGTAARCIAAAVPASVRGPRIATFSDLSAGGADSGDEQEGGAVGGAGRSPGAATAAPVAAFAGSGRKLGSGSGGGSRQNSMSQASPSPAQTRALLAAAAARRAAPAAVSAPHTTASQQRRAIPASASSRGAISVDLTAGDSDEDDDINGDDELPDYRQVSRLFRAAPLPRSNDSSSHGAGYDGYDGSDVEEQVLGRARAAPAAADAASIPIRVQWRPSATRAESGSGMAAAQAAARAIAGAAPAVATGKRRRGLRSPSRSRSPDGSLGAGIAEDGLKRRRDEDAPRHSAAPAGHRSGIAAPRRAAAASAIVDLCSDSD